MDELEAIRARKLAELREELKARTTAVDGPVVLTDTIFEEVVGRAPLTLVDFWAPWCGPCRYVAPVVEALARDYAGRLTVGKLDVDENPRTAERFGVRSIPTLLLFRNGQLVEGIVGAVPRAQLEGLIRPWL